MSAILLTLCEPHILEAFSTPFSQITPGSYTLLSLSPYCPYVPPALHFCSCFLGIGQSERSPTRTLAWYRISAELTPGVGQSTSRSSSKSENRVLPLDPWWCTRKGTLPLHGFSEATSGPMEIWRFWSKREENLWETALLCPWGDGNCDPWLPAQWRALWSKARTCHAFYTHASSYPRHSIGSAASLPLLVPAGTAASSSTWVANTCTQVQPSRISLHPCARCPLLPISGFLGLATCKCELWGKTLVRGR